MLSYDSQLLNTTPKVWLPHTIIGERWLQHSYNSYPPAVFRKTPLTSIEYDGNTPAHSNGFIRLPGWLAAAAYGVVAGCACNALQEVHHNCSAEEIALLLQTLARSKP